MIIRKTSLISGITRELDLPITEIEWERYTRGARVQDAFPLLNADQREYLLTGTTPEEWDTVFPDGPQPQNGSCP